MSTMANPQSNGVLERTHQVLANTIQTFELEEFHLNADDPWHGILSAVMHAAHDTHHTTLMATPGQLAFGHNVSFNAKCIANWNLINQRKQATI